MYLYVFVFIFMYLYVFVCIYMYLYVFKYICICLYLYVFLCIYTYLYVFIKHNYYDDDFGQPEPDHDFPVAEDYRCEWNYKPDKIR